MQFLHSNFAHPTMSAFTEIRRKKMASRVPSFKLIKIIGTDTY